MKLSLGIALAGIGLMVLGFIVDQATHIPFVLRVIAPRYVRANDGAQTLFTKNALARLERGFDDLVELYISTRLKNRPPAELFPVSLSREANTITLVDEGPVTIIYVTWNTGEKTQWNQRAVQKGVDSFLDSSLTFWKSLLFGVGLMLNCLSLFLEYGSHKTLE